MKLIPNGCFQIKYLKYVQAVVCTTHWQMANQTLAIARKLLRNFSTGRTCRCLTCCRTARISAPAIKHNLTKTQVRTISHIPHSTLYTLAYLIDPMENITKQKQNHVVF